MPIIKQWTLEEGANYIAQFQKKARELDYNLALGGGVLDRGFSFNDLDILCIPRSNKRIPKKQELLELISGDVEVLNINKGYKGEEIEGRDVYRFTNPENELLVDLIFIEY